MTNKSYKSKLPCLWYWNSPRSFCAVKNVGRGIEIKKQKKGGNIVTVNLYCYIHYNILSKGIKKIDMTVNQ